MKCMKHMKKMVGAIAPVRAIARAITPVIARAIAPAIALMMTAVMVCSFTGCGKKVVKDESGRTVIGTVDGENIYLDDAKFLLSMQQLDTEQSYALLAGSNPDASFWQQSTSSTDKSTMETSIKADTYEKAVSRTYLLKYAAQNGITLSDEEKKDIESRVDSFLDSMKAEFLEAAGGTKEVVLAYFQYDEIQNKVIDKLTEGETFEVSDEDIATTEVEYTVIEAADDGSTGYSADDAETIAADIKDRTEAGETFTDLVAEHGLETYQTSVVSADATGDIATVIAAMKEGEVANVIQNSYMFVLHCTGKDAEESLEQTKADKIEEMKKASFNTKWQEILSGVTSKSEGTAWSSLKIEKTLCDLV